MNCQWLKKKKNKVNANPQKNTLKTFYKTGLTTTKKKKKKKKKRKESERQR
jgi:hypothetical protein